MRTKRWLVEPDGESCKKITAEMEDEYHHIILQLRVDEAELKIRRIELALNRCPEPACTECEKTVQALIDSPVMHPQFRFYLLRSMGGERGCVHVLELLSEMHDYLRSFVWDGTPDAEGRYTISRLEQAGQVKCIAYGKKDEKQ